MQGKDTRKPKKAWTFNRNDFSFVSEIEALPNPFEKSKWMYPPRAVSVKPPKSRKGYVLTWIPEDEKWKNVKIEVEESTED